MKKIIFCDIDNTLTKYSFKVSKQNIESIKKFTDAGGDFVLTTGRSIVSARKIQDQINEALQMKPKYIICSNGGYIVDNVNGDVDIYTIDESICRQLYRIIIKQRVWGMFYTDLSNDLRGVFITKLWFWFFLGIFKNLNALKIRENTDLSSFKIIICHYKKSRIKQFAKILDKSFGKKVSYVMTTPFSIEINALGVNKASGVQKILERADLNKQDAAAIGDSGNDVPLFKMVSLPIAVKTKNADVIRNSLVYIPKFKNGVSIAIEKYIMK